ncbi:hypothetical protein Acsp03_02440 [Actinomadura sp. NBRC 104412]|nr:hypothetical protein Acsp03_02440 [Actinomadura sp. NBRC 104412]
MHESEVSRRTLLRGTGVAMGGAVLGTAASTAPAAAEERAGRSETALAEGTNISATAAHFLDGICSAYHDARFFGLA